MPRRKKQERKIGRHTKEAMEAALELVERGLSRRRAAKESNIPYPTLRRYVKKKSIEGNQISLTPNYEVNRVFSLEEEDALVNYYKTCALMFYGLTIKDCRKVAYDMAILNHKKIPESWRRNSIAGNEWFRCFRNRHSDLSLRKPEPCSLARATAFNRENVKTFFENLAQVLQREPKFADGTRIYNLDETGTSTVQKPQKVIAPTGLSNVGKVTSSEKGTLVTTCCIVSATGHALPPAIVFPRKNFRDIMLHGAPPGSLGLAAPTGWMNSTIFVDVMKHFITHSSSSPDNPSLLIMDNHESHLSIEALDLAKKSGVTILTLHPHTSAKLQPLDVGLLSPFKTYYYSALESWMLRFPGKPVTIYQIAEFVGHAYPRAMTPVNIAAAFMKCGLFPMNRDIFSDNDFMPSSVTDRPLANELEQPQPETVTANEDADATQDINELYQNNANGITENAAGTKENCTPMVKISGPTGSKPMITPDMFRPPIKAGPRSNKRKPRKRGKSMIATDTPEKDAIAIERAAAKEKKDTCKRKVLQDLTQRQDNPSTSGCIKIRRKRKYESESESEEEFISSDSSSGGEFSEETESEDVPIIDENFSPISRSPKEGDYVLVSFSTKKLSVYYIARVQKQSDDDEYLVSFLRIKHKEAHTFMFPQEPDLSDVNISDIKFILPLPHILGSKKRQETFQFKVDLSMLNMR